MNYGKGICKKGMKPITLTRIKRKLIRTFFLEQWSLLLCDIEGNILTSIAPAKDRIWADPFPVEYNGKFYVFAEQQIGSQNGILGVMEILPDMTRSDFIPILEKEYHLSFPNIFNIDINGKSNWYMIPETYQHNTIDLYKAVDFPYKWEYEMTLMSGVMAVDSTVFYYNKKWWLFTSIGTKEIPFNTNLALFYSDSFPSNTWISHPQNPVCTSAENSRMAGSVFVNRQTGLPNRPAQNCLKDYGKETNINEVFELTPDSYKERIIKTIFPDKELYAVCTHTLNYSEHYMVRDIKTRKFRLFC
jgi:hypothetical protein